MRACRILHVTPQLSLGGGGQGLISLTKASVALGGFEHRAISLAPADPVAELQARQAGLELSPVGEVDSLMESADILQVHFWNDPGMSGFLRSRHPDRRMLLWSHVRGTSAPQVLTRSVMGLATNLVVSSPASLEIPAVARLAEKRRCSVIPAGVDPHRLSGLRRSTARQVRVGYLGSLDFAKLHPDFIRWSGAISGPIRFVVGGEGPDRKTLEQEARRLGIENRFEFLGHVRDIRDFFGQIDILGHLLAADSYGTSELVVAEALLAGIPPVLLRDRGGSFLVRHRRTGLIATDGASYVRAIEELAGDFRLRRRLGRNASEWARARLSSETCALRFHRLYRRMLQAPKTPHSEAGEVASGAGAFIESLGRWGRPFRDSVDGGPRASAADRKIARSSAGLASASAGGIVHYRLHYPEDPHLALWSGLVFEQRGRLALAAAEYARAARHSLGARATEGLARILHRAREAPRPLIPSGETP